MEINYLFDHNLINEDTGEIIELDSTACSLDDDALLQKVVAMNQLLKYINGIKQATDLEFINRMDEKEAHRLENDDLKVTISKKVAYDYDVNKVEELKQIITPEQFNKTFKIAYKANRTHLKGLLAFGGQIKKVINEMVIEKENKPYINIEYKNTQEF